MTGKINTYNESSLHYQIKQWYMRSGDEPEKEINGFIIDIVRNEQLIEIQTANFSAIKRKLLKLLPHYKVHLIYPIAGIKWICQNDENNNYVYKRKSPRKGKPLDIFSELVRIPELIVNPNFSLEILMVELEEIRCKDGKGSWRRKGNSISDRRLIKVMDSIRFEKAADILTFIPDDLKEPFTTRDLAKELKVSITPSRRIAYSLRKMGLFINVGKRGGAILYRKIRTDFREEEYYQLLLSRLPQNPLVIGKENYFHSVVFVPFIEIDNEQFILFEKRSENIIQPGEICFPGGGVDHFKDNTIEDTAVRETIEELRVKRENIEIGGELGAVINPLGSFVEVIVGRLNIDSIEDLDPNPKEVERVFLVPVQYFKDNPPEEFKLKTEVHSIVTNKNGEELELFPAEKLGIPRKYWRSWGKKFRKVYVYKFDNEIIWGITAEIIRSVINRLDL